MRAPPRVADLSLLSDGRSVDGVAYYVLPACKLRFSFVGQRAMSVGVDTSTETASLNTKRARFLPWIAVLALIALPAMRGSANSSLPGQPAPDFALKAMDGANLRLSEFLGDVVMINFWATWCGSCRQEMPELERLHDTYRSAGFVLIGVNVDDESARAVEFVRALKVTYPILLDPRRSVAPLYRLDELPMSVLIDRAGVVRFVHADYQAGKEQPYLAELRNLLNE
jgi:peroxiredoxin